jgi:hypothetical protein
MPHHIATRHLSPDTGWFSACTSVADAFRKTSCEIFTSFLARGCDYYENKLYLRPPRRSACALHYGPATFQLLE